MGELYLITNTEGGRVKYSDHVTSCQHFEIYSSFVLKSKMPAYVDKDTGHEVSVVIFSVFIIFWEAIIFCFRKYFLRMIALAGKKKEYYFHNLECLYPGEYIA